MLGLIVEVPDMLGREHLGGSEVRCSRFTRLRFPPQFQIHFSPEKVRMVKNREEVESLGSFWP